MARARYADHREQRLRLGAYATMLALLLAVIGLLANSLFRLEGRIDGLGRDIRAEMRDLRTELRTEMHDGFAQVDNRLRVLERDRS